uniref:Uncharacterized protein n=1 Tax=Arundo donax TaxID=35708 RepID=A0A0A9GCX7_ARUDO
MPQTPSLGDLLTWSTHPVHFHQLCKSYSSPALYSLLKLCIEQSLHRVYANTYSAKLIHRHAIVELANSRHK